MEKTKICSCCGKELPISSFNKNPSRKNGVASICRECMHARYSCREWAKYNMALDRFPWPFDDDYHAMDMEAIKEYKQEKALMR